MKIVITTQTEENYAFHSWDGEGECPQHWKQKGGSEFIVEDYEFHDSDTLALDAETLSNLISFSNDACRVFVSFWQLEDDNYVPAFEREQLEHEGLVTHFEPCITLNGLIKQKTLNSNGEIVYSIEDLNAVNKKFA